MADPQRPRAVSATQAALPRIGADKPVPQPTQATTTEKPAPKSIPVAEAYARITSARWHAGLWGILIGFALCLFAVTLYQHQTLKDAGELHSDGAMLGKAMQKLDEAK